MAAARVCWNAYAPALGHRLQPRRDRCPRRQRAKGDGGVKRTPGAPSLRRTSAVARLRRALLADRETSRMEVTMDDHRREALLKEYGEVSNNFRLLTDIRF